MRLDKLWLGSFRNLTDVLIDFDEESLSTILIGPNGSGKSNLLEAIAWIFRNLNLVTDPPFKYVLDYEIRGVHVHIDGDRDRERDKTQVFLDGRSVPFRSLEDINRKTRDYCRPSLSRGQGLLRLADSLFTMQQSAQYPPTGLGQASGE